MTCIITPGLENWSPKIPGSKSKPARKSMQNLRRPAGRCRTRSVSIQSKKSASLKLSPSAERLKEVEKDYQAMQVMIFDKQLSFTEIIDSLADLEIETSA